MAARPPSISSRLLSERLRSSVTSTSSASWCLAYRSFHGAGAASASWRSEGLAPTPMRVAIASVAAARQPARLGREDVVLLPLRLEQQQVQKLLLPPQQRRQVLVVHAPHRLL